MTGYKWKPIEDLPDDWQKLASSELAGLFAVWKEHVVTLKDSPAYLEFQTRLRREWAIETGIIEGLYDIDRGVTRTLIERGLHASLIAHGDANKPAEEIIPMLKDHEAVVEGLFDFVGQQRELSTSYIKQIHQALTTHQETATGIDSFGQSSQIPLLQGDWKKWPNNPTRPDGLVHEYCPPEQVASEMDRLIEMHRQHLQEGVPPEVEAAWLHHRFTQIHPFQDGNGRVARALASLIFIRAGWFPFVVHRDDRSRYIDCLEIADASELTSLINLFGRIQRGAFNQAIKLSSNVLLSADSLDHVIFAGGKTLKERENEAQLKKEEWQKRYSQYRKLAESLFTVTTERLEKVVNRFIQIFTEIGIMQKAVIGKEDSPFARMAGWFYNADSQKVAALMDIDLDTGGDGWVSSIRVNSVYLHFCFYTIRNSDHQLACGLAFLTHIGGTEFVLLGQEVFQCATNENIDSVTARYKQWLEEALILGFEEWRKRL